MSRLSLLSTAALLVASLSCAVPSAGAADGPAGLYHLDVEASLANLRAAGVNDPAAREMLEQVRNLMVLRFQGGTVTFLSGADSNGKPTGSCQWRLDQDAVVLDRCQPAETGGAFGFNGQLSYDTGSDTVTMRGAADKPPIAFRK
ncbi:MAG: hypothetical protein PHS60_15990 [Zavarzinia sp.]|nr:hypothetical protein [Zavarzinia sp.]